AISLPTSSLSENWFVLSNSSWLSLDTVLSDGAREPWKVSLASYAFSPGSTQQLKATASYGSGPVREHVFNLKVEDAIPPVIRITAPYVVSETCGFSLDASATYDPIAPTTDDLVFWWSCATGTGTIDCRRLVNFGPQIWILKNGTGSSGPLLIVDGGQLTEGNYTFTLQVLRVSDQASITKAWTLDVVKAPTVSIATTPSWYDGQSVSTQPNTVGPTSTAYIRTGQGCGERLSAQWLWALVEAESPFNIVTYFGNSSDASTFAALPGDVPYDYLLPGFRYSYALLEQADQMPPTLLDAETQGLAFGRTVPFLADAPPAAGQVACVPMIGTAAATDFFISSSGWHDEDMSNLSYSYYLLPLPAGVSLANDGNGGVSVSGNFVPPQVDWKDTSSPNHWIALGGICLGHSQSMLQLRLPAGQHMLAVLVEDSLGAVSSAFLAGPLVEASSSAADIEKGLDIAVISNNAEIILSTLDATSGTGFDATKEAEAFTAAARVDMSAIPSVGVNRLPRVVYSVAVAYATEVEEVVLRTEQLTSLATELGNAILATVQLDGSQVLSWTQDGRGLQVYVAKKEVTDLPYEGLNVGGLSMPAYTFQTDPLVQYLIEAGPSCKTVEVQLTTWLQSNPYAWANQTTYASTFVSSDSTVVVLQIQHCLSDEILNLSQRTLTLELPLPERPTASLPEGHVYKATCAVFDPDERQWTRDGVR
ncbi:unnamed protein product, partial [Durusdinium trenchii]